LCFLKYAKKSAWQSIFYLRENAIIDRIYQMQKVFSIILLLLILPLWANFSGSAWVGIRFDSNICSLSDYDLNRFETGEKEFLLSTSDDAITRIGGSIRYYTRLGKFRLYANTSLWSGIYLKNSAINYLSASGYFRIRLKGTSAQISIGGTPRYRSRAYIDDDSVSTQWSEYKSFWSSCEISQNVISQFHVSAKYKKSFYQYCDYFPEYDSDRDEFEFAISKSGRTSIELGYRFTNSDARGYDHAGEMKEESDESDISYEQDLANITLNHDFELMNLECTPEISGQFYRRLYTSIKPYWIDPYHLGRTEMVWQITPSARVGFGSKMWTKLECSFRYRRAESDFNPDIPKLRDYDRFLFSITVGRNF